MTQYYKRIYLYPLDLCQRVQRRSTLYFTSQYAFELRGVEDVGKHALIKAVVERFSTIKRVKISEGDAAKLYERLAKKYCGSYRHATLRALQFSRDKAFFTRYAHPKEYAEKEMQQQVARWDVECATHNSSGDYCVLDDDDGFFSCHLCGERQRYTLFSRGEIYKIYRYQKSPAKAWLCRSPLCKAAVKIFPTLLSAQNRLPMARIIMELTKNGDRTGAIAKLAQATNENIRATHDSANRQKRSTGNSHACLLV